jgi:hydrogenase maturation protease
MRTAIVGVGNVLMKDDGVGVHVARALRELPLPDGVEVTDAGTCADVAFDLAGADRVIVIDAARGGGPAGAIYRLAEDAVPGVEGVQSGHDVALLHVLRHVVSGGHAPEIVVIGVEPKEVDCGLELSPAVSACLPRVIDAVQQELRGCRCS